MLRTGRRCCPWFHQCTSCINDGEIYGLHTRPEIADGALRSISLPDRLSHFGNCHPMYFVAAETQVDRTEILAWRLRLAVQSTFMLACYTSYNARDDSCAPAGPEARAAGEQTAGWPFIVTSVVMPHHMTRAECITGLGHSLPITRCRSRETFQFLSGFPSINGSVP